MARTLAIIAVAILIILVALVNGQRRFRQRRFRTQQRQRVVPVMFPDELRQTWSMTMKRGLAMEDKDMHMTSNKENAKPNQQITKENVITDMANMINDIEGPSAKQDPLMNQLMTKMKTENMKQTFLNRNGEVPSTDPFTNPRFESELKQILSANGIETDLPFDCGRHPDSPSNPLSSASESYPWVAALGSSEDGRFHYRCVGLIITNTHIITDADCAKSANINIAQLNVTGHVPTPHPIQAYVVGRRAHPDIRNEEDDLLNGNSIGILELANPVPFSEYVQPVCLPGMFAKPDPNALLENDFIIGFDEIEDRPSGRTARLYTWQSISIGAAACYEHIREQNEKNKANENMLFKIITKKHICLNRNFKDVGKSVVVRVNPSTGRVTAVGVAALANAAVDKPILYTMAQPHRFFIDMVLKKYRENTQPTTVPTSTVPVIS